jgi:hypothetical protein
MEASLRAPAVPLQLRRTVVEVLQPSLAPAAARRHSAPSRSRTRTSGRSKLQWRDVFSRFELLLPVGADYRWR